MSTYARKWTNSEIDAAKTFALQDFLPSLPLPSLDQTKAGYLRAVKPLLSSEDYLRTKATVSHYFDSPQAHAAQKQLIQRAATSKNWLEEWWNSLAYLRFREPLYPLLNFGGCSLRWEEFGPRPGSQLERAALTGWLGAQYWLSLHRQEIPVMRTSKAAPLCMEQFRSIFCTARIPKPGEDLIRSEFRTRDDELQQKGQCPKFIVVVMNGHYWKMDVFDSEKDEILPYQDFRRGLEEVAKSSQEKKPAVGALTCLNRDEWAEEKRRLTEASTLNAQSFWAVDSSIFCLSLTDASPTSEDQVSHQAVAGSAAWQYADKSMLWHVHQNGLASTSCDHSPNEGIVMVAVSNYIDSQLIKLGFRPPPDPPEVTREQAASSPSACRVEELPFHLDSRAISNIERAERLVKRYSDDINIRILRYSEYSRSFCKSLGYNVDTVMQVAAQAAYVKLHGTPASVYETASTKQFFHGRTETMKSCTQESVDFARSLVANEAGSSAGETKAATRSPPGELLAKLKAAVRTHDAQMRACQGGIGVDRHLLGLRVQSSLLGLPDPPIFSDPAYIKQGGDGNYVVSTSYLGGTNTYGGVVPMICKGYGVFYKADDKEITVFMSEYKTEPSTSLEQYEKQLIWALGEIRRLLELPQAKL